MAVVTGRWQREEAVSGVGSAVMVTLRLRSNLVAAHGARSKKMIVEGSGGHSRAMWVVVVVVVVVTALYSSRRLCRGRCWDGCEAAGVFEKLQVGDG